MSTLLEELTALKTAEDKITGNKVANFAYDDYAYEHDDANGVNTYNVNNHQNIPNGTANILKVNPTILTKGWRAQASAITRMLIDHFLGRCSYNLNKVNDHFSSLLTKLIAFIGEPNGLATLDENGRVALLNNVVNTGDSNTPTENGTNKFTTGGAYVLQQAINGKAPTNHASTTTDYGVAYANEYGHVKTSYSVSNVGYEQTIDPSPYTTYGINLTRWGILSYQLKGTNDGVTVQLRVGSNFTELEKAGYIYQIYRGNTIVGQGFGILSTTWTSLSTTMNINDHLVLLVSPPQGHVAML